MVYHNGRVHGRKVDLRHIAVQPDEGLVDQAALIGFDQLYQRFPALRLLLDNRHKHIRAQGGQHLHGGDTGPRRLTCHLLHSDAGYSGLLQDSVHSIFIEQHGVAAVDVPAAIKVRLCAAMDHLTVCKIAVCFAREHFPCFIPIGIDLNASLLAPDIQLWKQPGVAVIGQDQIGVITAQGAHADRSGRRGGVPGAGRMQLYRVGPTVCLAGDGPGLYPD